MSMTDQIVGGNVVLGGTCNSLKPGYIAKPIATMNGNVIQSETIVNSSSSSSSPSRPISSTFLVGNHHNSSNHVPASFIFGSPTNQTISNQAMFGKEQREDIISCRSSSRFQRVCVFCGACSGSREVFQEAAVELGKQLVMRSIGLVYGGGSVGLMGRISRVVSDGGQDVLGVIPRALMKEEITGRTIGKVVVVNSMHERKAEMARLSDAFIALPGGYGTLEELLEVITWSQLGIHKKPVGLLNVGGYYDSLLAFLDNAVGEGFIQPAARHIFVSADNAYDLMRVLEDYVACHDQVAAKLCWGNVDYSGEISPTFL